MASFNDARASAREIPVEAGPSPSVVNTVVAESISAFGQFAGDFRKAALKAGVLDELQEAGNIIGTLNDPSSRVVSPIELEGPTIDQSPLLSDTFVDISKSDPTGVLNQSSPRFRRLAFAREQGIITPQRAALEAELILRNAISRAPSFATELRKFAADALGFDPSGAVLGGLFGRPIGGILPKTKTQLLIEQAEANAFNNPTTTVLEQVALLQQKEIAAAEQTIFTRDVGEADRLTPALADRFAIGLERELSLALGNILASEGGSIQDEVALAATFASILQSNKTKARTIAARSRVSFSSIESVLDSTAKAFQDIATNSSLREQLVGKTNLAAASAKARAYQIAPAILVMSQIDGMVDLYNSALISSAGNTELFNELLRNSGKVGQALIDLSVNDEQITKGILDIMSGQIDPTDALQAALADLMITDGVRKGKDEVLNQGLEYTRAAGRKRRSLSAAASFPNSFERISDENRASILVDHPIDTKDTVAKLGTSMVGQELRYNGTEFFTISEAQADVERGLISPSTFRGSTLIGEQLGAGINRDALDYLNKGLLNLVQKPQWQKALKIDSVDKYVSDVIAGINVAKRITLQQAESGEFFTPPGALSFFFGSGEPNPFEIPVVGGVPAIDVTEREAVTPITEPTLVQTADGEFVLINQGNVITAQDALKQDIFQTFKKAPDISDFSPDIAIIIGREAERRKYDARLLFSLAKAESSGDADARASINFPKSNASGLFQMQPGTFNDFIPEGAKPASKIPGLEEDIFNPIFNVQAAMNHLDALFEKFGDQGLKEVIIRWHDGLFSEKESPSAKAVTLAERVLKDLGLSG